MAGKVGKNATRTANDVRPFICEVFGGAEGLTITNASLFATYAGATFPLSGANIDPEYTQLCGLEVALAGLDDETAQGEISTTCDAVVTDTETGKTKNLEPGGNYALEVPLGNSIPDVEIFVSPGSVVVVCGMFCSKVNGKTLEVFASLQLPEDTFGVPRPATAGEVGTLDFFGNPIEPGANVVEYPGGKLVCQPSKSDVTISTDLDNYFGTITVGDNDPIPFLTQNKTKSGTPLDPASNKLLDEATNPPVGWSKVDGAVQVDLCDGSAFCFRSVTENDSDSYTAAQISDVASDTPAGTVLSPEDGCVTIPPQKLGTIARVEVVHGYSTEEHSGDWGGSFGFRPEISINGGGWVPMTTGGTDQVIIARTPPGNAGPVDHPHGEHSINDIRYFNIPADTETTICYRIVLLTNGVSGTGVSPTLVETTAANLYVEWEEMRCGTIAAAPLVADENDDTDVETI